MDLKHWREQREQGEPFELQSGLVVRLRRVSLLDLAERGEIPAPLVGLVEGFVGNEDSELSLDEFDEFSGVINLVVGATMVEPPVADEADDEHLALSELPVGDRIAIFRWANRQAVSLRPFRGEEGQPPNAA